MQTSEYVVISADHSNALSPLKALSLSLIDLLSNFRKLSNVSERGTVEEYQRVLAGVDSHVIPHIKLGELIEKNC